MLFKPALVLLVAWPIAWLLGSLGFHSIGEPVHVLLLVGLLLMLLALAKERDAALGHGKRRADGTPPDEREH